MSIHVYTNYIHLCRLYMLWLLPLDPSAPFPVLRLVNFWLYHVFGAARCCCKMCKVLIVEASVTLFAVPLPSILKFLLLDFNITFFAMCCLARSFSSFFLDKGRASPETYRAESSREWHALRLHQAWWPFLALDYNFIQSFLASQTSTMCSHLEL